MSGLRAEFRDGPDIRHAAIRRDQWCIGRIGEDLDGRDHVSPETVSDNHHHGESETAIFVRSGNPEFVFHDGVQEVRIATAPGDYIFVPPYVPHREENPDPNNPAVIVIARSTQEAIVVNLPELYALSEMSE